jgi:hypothetical protein
VLSFDIGQVSRVKKIKRCCWKEPRVFRGERRRHMRWPDKLGHPEQGSRRELMKMKKFLSEIKLNLKPKNYAVTLGCLLLLLVL